jgi:alpha-ketoglutarate-dependent taurine dioxygenase
VREARPDSPYDPVVVAAAFSVRALDDVFGAVEISGIDPAVHVDEQACAEVRAVLWAHAVVCLRFPRPLDEDEARAVAGLIGPIKDPVARTRNGGTMRYSEDRQIIDAGFVLTDELREQLGDVNFGGDGLRPGLFETFHTDDTYTERPARATVLHARELPSGPGGATNFIDMRAAFRLLEPQVQARIIGLRAVHSYNNLGAFPPRVPAEGPFEQLVDVAHPISRAHPVTGTPALYLDLDRATHVEGLPVDEGRALLQSLQDHAEAKAPRYAHAWQPHDVLIWDNASVQHKASGDFPVGEPRRFWRFMIEGPAPLAFRF